MATPLEEFLDRHGAFLESLDDEALRQLSKELREVLERRRNNLE